MHAPDFCAHETGLRSPSIRLARHQKWPGTPRGTSRRRDPNWSFSSGTIIVWRALTTASRRLLRALRLQIATRFASRSCRALDCFDTNSDDFQEIDPRAIGCCGGVLRRCRAIPSWIYCDNYSEEHGEYRHLGFSTGWLKDRWNTS